MPQAQLINQACAHFNDRQAVDERCDTPEATPASEPGFLDRIAVNYLRHCLSP